MAKAKKTAQGAQNTIVVNNVLNMGTVPGQGPYIPGLLMATPAVPIRNQKADSRSYETRAAKFPDDEEAIARKRALKRRAQTRRRNAQASVAWKEEQERKRRNKNRA